MIYIIDIFLAIGIIACIIALIRICLMLDNRISFLEKNAISDINEMRKENRNENDLIENSIANGLIRGLHQLREDEDNQERLLELARKTKNMPSKIYNQTSAELDTFNTNGDLIPANLTDEEKKILKLYYGRD
jgi:hypothetical protein